jgi:hypothetical protein
MAGAIFSRFSVLQRIYFTMADEGLPSVDEPFAGMVARVQNPAMMLFRVSPNVFFRTS